MVDATLKQLDAWYNEPSAGSDRPKLLAKLAVLELCGWLEGEFDRLALVAQHGRLDDPAWVKEEIIEHTNGFNYSKHWRPMLVRLVGEVFARRVETHMEAVAPGDLERLKTALGSLWTIRCGFAHSHVVASVAAQQTFSAPSWSINQHRIIKKLLTRYEQEMLVILGAI